MRKFSSQQTTCCVFSGWQLPFDVLLVNVKHTVSDARSCLDVDDRERLVPTLSRQLASFTPPKSFKLCHVMPLSLYHAYVRVLNGITITYVSEVTLFRILLCSP